MGQRAANVKDYAKSRRRQAPGEFKKSTPDVPGRSGLPPLDVLCSRQRLGHDLHRGARRMADRHNRLGWLVLALGLGLAPAVVHAEPVGRITGLGGVFLKSKDPEALARWYRDVLGIPLEPWGGATLRYDAPGHPPAIVWNAFPNKTDYMDPSTREFMINFAVDDLDAYLGRLAAKGVTVLKRQDGGPTGKFAWILDPDGTKIELWQPQPK